MLTIPPLLNTAVLPTIAVAVISAEELQLLLLRQVQLPQLELLIAGHHGSNTATSFDLLFATQPQAVAISVGEDNIYGHPGQDMLERLEHFGCQVYRTDLEGTIVFRR